MSWREAAGWMKIGWRWLVLVSVIGLTACSYCSESRPDLVPAVEDFWQMQVDGRFELAYTRFLPAALERLKSDNPEMFASPERYAKMRGRWAIKNPISSFRVLETRLDSDGLTGRVKIGLVIHGRDEALTLIQHWRLDKPSNQWRIDRPAVKTAGVVAP